MPERLKPSDIRIQGEEGDIWLRGQTGRRHHPSSLALAWAPRWPVWEQQGVQRTEGRTAMSWQMWRIPQAMLWNIPQREHGATRIFEQGRWSGQHLGKIALTAV